MESEGTEDISTTSAFQRAFDSSTAFGKKSTGEDTTEKIAEDEADNSSVSSDLSTVKAGSEDTKKHEKRGEVEEPPSGQRAEWGNHFEFFLTSLGLAVGLGNIWRFPYICYTNGGGTFLIPYFIILVTLGIPMFFLELTLGQWAGSSCTVIFRKMFPVLKGLGYGMLSINIIINFYYTVIMAWSLIYMYEGWQDPLPWERCSKDYGTINCFSKPDSTDCEDESTTFWNFTCTSVNEFCAYYGYQADPNNFTFCLNGTEQVGIKNVTERMYSAEEFFKYKVLGLTEIGVTDTWENYGPPQWHIIGSLAIAWTLIAITLVKGISSYGKLSYFITLFPYVVLTTFLIYVAQEDGFSDGVEFFTSPDWDRLWTFEVWKEAITQIFYTLGLAVGSQLVLSSYNNYDANCHRDAWLIALCNCLTSVYAGFVVFGTLGMLAYDQGRDIEDVIVSGTGLAFIVYPAAVTIMNPPQLFSFMFFFMVTLLAISSISGSWESTVAAVFDDFPQLRKHTSKVYFASCFIAFLGGVSCCFPSGYYMFNLLDARISNSVVYLALVQVLVISWFLGARTFAEYIDDMGFWFPAPFRWFFLLDWYIINPAILAVAIFNLFYQRPADSVEGYEFPAGVQALGWMIELFPLVLPIAIGIPAIFKHGMEAFRMTDEWGPRPDRPADTNRPDTGIFNAGYDVTSPGNDAIYTVDEKRTSL